MIHGGVAVTRGGEDAGVLQTFYAAGSGSRFGVWRMRRKLKKKWVWIEHWTS